MSKGNNIWACIFIFIPLEFSGTLIDHQREIKHVAFNVINVLTQFLF